MIPAECRMTPVVRDIRHASAASVEIQQRDELGRRARRREADRRRRPESTACAAPPFMANRAESASKVVRMDLASTVPSGTGSPSTAYANVEEDPARIAPLEQRPRVGELLGKRYRGDRRTGTTRPEMSKHLSATAPILDHGGAAGE